MKGRRITIDKIKIAGGPDIKILKEFSYHLEPNQHATATIVGILAEEKDTKEWINFLGTQTVVTVSFQAEQGDKTIFSGYLNQINLQRKTGIPIVTMHLISGTILLDRTKIARSYQNISNSYANIVKEAIKETNYASCICTMGEQSFPEKPFIQYRESNWEFTHRLASQLKGVLYPDITTPLPRFYFGFPKEKEIKELEIEEYQAGFSEHFYELGGMEAGYSPQEFIFYQVKTSENISFDTGILWKGKHWRIGRKLVQLEKEELFFTYMLCQPKLVSLKPYYNSLFAGMSLLGTVLAGEGETLKLHLHIDKTQEIGTAYPYEWTPDTGSVMYCMPKVGTKVSLYFSSEEEASARVINCIRENGETCEGMSDPNYRGLSTEHGKKLFLNPKELGVSEEEKGNYLKLEDDVAVQLESNKKIEITAKGKAKFIAKQVLLETPVEINLARG